MDKIIEKLREKNIDISQLKILELFGYNGSMHIYKYIDEIKELDIFEIDPEYKDKLEKNFPGAEVRIVDSIREIKMKGKKYDLVICDNPMSIYGNDYCEHFELFPYIFERINKEGILVLNVIPAIFQDEKIRKPYLFNHEQMEKRSKFYNTKDPSFILIEDMVKEYRKKADEKDFRIDWWFKQTRGFVFYLVLKLRRLND